MNWYDEANNDLEDDLADGLNRIFQPYNDIVALCCEAWNKLIEPPWKIISIEMRWWAHGF